jgi:acyl-[acyl-carrier-protein] desaturase
LLALGETDHVSATIENRFYDLYLEYFHLAEEHRRWNMLKDIPWSEISRQPDPTVVRIMEAYMAVELYLPDYTSKILHLIRASRGRAWFQANWGYEESKHALALEMWLTKSGSRTDQEMREFEEEILAREWNLPYDTPLEMIVYTAFQEYATKLNYHGLRRVARDSGDPALDAVLALLARDEVSHFKFFKDGVKIFMDYDRDKVLEALNLVIKSFRMPAQDIIPDWNTRDQLIREMHIFDDRIYHREVVRPVLQSLGVDRDELREARRRIAAAEAEPVKVVGPVVLAAE